MHRLLTLFLVLTSFGSTAALAATITVTSPNGGEPWAAGTNHDINWTQTGGSALKVRIVLRQGQTLIGTIATNVSLSTGKFPWTVGALDGATAPTGAGYIIRIRTEDSTVKDDSDAGFAILPAAQPTVLKVLQPNGGETWPRGLQRTIRWQAGNVSGNVKLELLRNGAVATTIAPSVAASLGALDWIVADPSGGGAGSTVTGYKVRVSSLQTTLQDVSDGTFSLASRITMPARNMMSPATFLAPRPDLIVCKYFPKILAEGATEEMLSLKVFNIGTGDAGQSYLRMYVSGVPEGHLVLPSIKAGQSYVAWEGNPNFPYRFPAHGPISYTFHVDVDNDVKNEISETNNMIGGTIPRSGTPDVSPKCSDGKTH